jgi:hypothetical protein
LRKGNSARGARRRGQPACRLAQQPPHRRIPSAVAAAAAIDENL